MKTENTHQLSTQINPFASGVPARSEQNALGDSDQARAIAEIQSAMIIARRFPRNPVEAMDKILNACTRPSLAEGALYTYARGGTDISGPSIRLAEALAQNWGNLQFGIRELEQRNGESTVEAYAWDVETNTRQVKVFQVRHERFTKQGSKKLEDPRDIYELVANQGARRLRACILGVIPGDVIEGAVKQCEVTLASSSEVTPDGVKKLVEAFDKLGVTKAQLEKRIQRRIDSIQPAQMVSLRKVYASLKDGMSKPEDWFEVAATEQRKPFSKTEKPAESQAPDTGEIPMEHPAAPEQPAKKSPPQQSYQERLVQLVKVKKLDAAKVFGYIEFTTEFKIPDDVKTIDALPEPIAREAFEGFEKLEEACRG